MTGQQVAGHRPGRRRSARRSILWLAAMLAVGALLLGLVLMPLVRNQAVAGRGPLVGQRAPQLNAVDLAGRRWSLADGRGRLVWVNFWATWCPPCRKEMPAMEQLAERYGDRLLILGVDFGEEESAVEDFVARYGIRYPILLDPQFETFYRWSPQFGLPRHFFLDSSGTVIREFPGELPPDQMVRTVEELLGPSA